jgi:hypothetical protein
MGTVRGQTAEHGDTTHWICDLLHSTHGLSRKYSPGSGESRFVPGSGESRFVPGSGESRFVPGSGESRFVPGSGNPNTTDILFYIRCKIFIFFSDF